MEYKAIMKDGSEQIISHHGIKGQKWGVRRYQNEDGTLTEEGKLRYREDNNGIIFEESVATEEWGNGEVRYTLKGTDKDGNNKMFSINSKTKLNKQQMENNIKKIKIPSIDEIANTIENSDVLPYWFLSEQELNKYSSKDPLIYNWSKMGAKKPTKNELISKIKEFKNQHYDIYDDGAFAIFEPNDYNYSLIGGHALQMEFKKQGNDFVLDKKSISIAG